MLQGMEAIAVRGPETSGSEERRRTRSTEAIKERSLLRSSQRGPARTQSAVPPPTSHLCRARCSLAVRAVSPSSVRSLLDGLLPYPSAAAPDPMSPSSSVRPACSSVTSVLSKPTEHPSTVSSSPASSSRATFVSQESSTTLPFGIKPKLAHLSKLCVSRLVKMVLFH
ncbi:hypothetical protein B296_00037853 [Ensete ventricosum]|uniref:Uncharacterized protein n=1 Tax=Ensete ventricosum TaxID=4639 RepID=A0A426XXY6_ENSVE|nr:hypothetical protein B296_00037853 [Ensete ventricosum]